MTTHLSLKRKSLFFVSVVLEPCVPVLWLEWFVLFKRCAGSIQNSGANINEKKGYNRVFFPAGRFSLQGSWVVRSRLACQRLPLPLQPCFHISHKGIFVLLQSNFNPPSILFNSFRTKLQSSFWHDHRLGISQGLHCPHIHDHSFCTSI